MIAGTQPARIAKLSQVLADHALDAFFAWSPVTMDYLHGFAEGSAERFMTLGVRKSGECSFIGPALSESQARRSGIADIRVWKDGEDPVALFRSLCDQWSLKTGIVGVDDEMPAHMLLAMQEALPAALFKPASESVAVLTRRKDAHELDTMRHAGKIADEALPAALASLRPGVTERQLADILASEMKRLGGIPSFAIVGTGANGAEPHHLTDDTPVREGDVVILDFGCDYNGYQSDITRTVACGPASDEAHRVYEIVYRAHMAARNAISPAASAESVDQAARSVIESEGFGPQFMHRTGHGIGMRVHEPPNIVAGNGGLLEPGNCFSIEPGIYLANRFGVRIENIVTCTETGHASLNAEPSPRLLEIRH